MLVTLESTRAPERSLAQRMAALERANRVRTWRAGLKRELKAGRPAGPLLARPPAELDSMHVIDFLLALPKVGRVKAGKWLRSAKVSPSKTLGGLSDRQRGELLAFVSGRR